LEVGADDGSDHSTLQGVSQSWVINPRVTLKAVCWFTGIDGNNNDAVTEAHWFID